MNKGNRIVRVHMLLSEKEAKIIRERMAELGIINQSAFMRKMAIDGYIIHIDMKEICELSRLLNICSNNLNQYVRRANETGSIYAADIEDLNDRMYDIGKQMNIVLQQFAKFI